LPRVIINEAVIASAASDNFAQGSQSLDLLFENRSVRADGQRKAGLMWWSKSPARAAHCAALEPLSLRTTVGKGGDVQTADSLADNVRLYLLYWFTATWASGHGCAGKGEPARHRCGPRCPLSQLSRWSL